MSTDETLRFAIANRRLIELGYHGRLRVAEPHDYGVQRGVTRLLAYQLSAEGGAASRSVRGWRLLDVGEIQSCKALDTTFPGSRGGSHQQHFVWDLIHARVK